MATMTVYEVSIKRSGRWWAIRVPELRGVFSQALHRDDVEPMARDAIALYLDVPQDSFELDVRDVSPESSSVSQESPPA